MTSIVVVVVVNEEEDEVTGIAKEEENELKPPIVSRKNALNIKNTRIDDGVCAAVILPLKR